MQQLFSLASHFSYNLLVLSLSHLAGAPCFSRLIQATCFHSTTAGALCFSTHTTWRDADTIGSHLLSSIAIAVQKCTGMALRASGQKEADLVFGRE